jgi:hypothetical protein
MIQIHPPAFIADFHLESGGFFYGMILLLYCFSPQQSAGFGMIILDNESQRIFILKVGTPIKEDHTS